MTRHSDRAIRRLARQSIRLVQRGRTEAGRQSLHPRAQHVRTRGGGVRLDVGKLRPEPRDAGVSSAPARFIGSVRRNTARRVTARCRSVLGSSFTRTLARLPGSRPASDSGMTSKSVNDSSARSVCRGSVSRSPPVMVENCIDSICLDPAGQTRPTVPSMACAVARMRISASASPRRSTGTTPPPWHRSRQHERQCCPRENNADHNATIESAQILDVEPGAAASSERASDRCGPSAPRAASHILRPRRGLARSGHERCGDAAPRARHHRASPVRNPPCHGGPGVGLVRGVVEHRDHVANLDNIPAIA